MLGIGNERGEREWMTVRNHGTTASYVDKP